MVKELRFEVPEKYRAILTGFYQSYLKEGLAGGYSQEVCDKEFDTFLHLMQEQLNHPHSFEAYHRHVRAPFDYYAFGLDFFRPLVDMGSSTAHGLEYAAEIATHIASGNNVILFANHQIEADPQAISLLLENHFPELGEEMIFVAGERVLTDPLAIPFSLGRNLLCIYSKRYIDRPPEQKSQKQQHNKMTMMRMGELLSSGGKCIYVAPSGGRDRPNAKGVVEVAPFDPQSIEMFALMAQRSTRPTLFYTLALCTYPLLPPPAVIQVELGENRHAKRGGIQLCFGPRVDMMDYQGASSPDKHARRAARAHHIWHQVVDDYAKISPS
jgi:glycerol-3-phosphate O-acyltransferase